MVHMNIEHRGKTHSPSLVHSPSFAKR